MPPVVAALVEVGINYYIAYAIVYVAEALALNAVLRALAPRQPKPADQPRTQSVSDSLQHGKILYGMVCVGGAHIIPPISTRGTDPTDGGVYEGHWTHRGLVFSQHEVDSYGPLRYDQAYIDQARLLHIALSLDDGLVTASDNPNAPADPFDNVLHQSRWTMARCYRGTSSDTNDFILFNADPVAFGSSFRSRGVACAFFTFGYGDIFSAGVPPISACINGKRVYDPRKDSTNGGLGTHRYNTPTTWEWSCNPILCAADLIIFDRELGGGGYDPNFDVDWPLVAAAANICDAPVDSAPIAANLVTYGTGATLVGNLFTKTGGGSNSWDAAVRSTVGIRAGRISFCVPGGAAYGCIAGLSISPLTDASYVTIDYGWMAQAAGWTIRENGAQVGGLTYGVPTSTDIAEVLYDGTNILYLLNGKIIRHVKVPTQGMTLYVDSSIAQINGSIKFNQQHRYTCNIELDGAALFEDNLGYLIDASFGRSIERGGVWRLYAGAWDSPTTTINQNDWIGQMQIQAVTPRREGRWNGVRSFYYDPMRNWQRVECNARTNAAYKTADGGERIWQELDRPAVNDESLAQRMAEFTLRQSRNGIKVSGTLPPRFQYVAIWETVQLNFADMGWTGKNFRVMGYTLNPDGSVGISLTEEQASDWTDMASSEYNQPDQHTIPQTNEQAPRTPTSLTATAFSESIVFRIGVPSFLPGEVVDIYESLTQGTTYPTGYTLVATNKANEITLRKSDNVSRYYRAVMRNTVSRKSSNPYPPVGTNAVEGHAGSHAYIGRGVHINGNSAYKLDTGVNADNSWDSDLVSILGYKRCHVAFKSGATAGGNVMCGLSAAPGVTASYVGIDYAWYNNIADWRIYEGGVAILTVSGAVRATDVAEIRYDGTNITYWLNGNLKRTVSAPGKTLFLDSSFYGFTDSMLNSIDFGPLAVTPVTDTSQLGDNATTDLYITYDAVQGVTGAGAGAGNAVALETVVVPAHDLPHTCIVTASFEMQRTSGGGAVLAWLDNSLGTAGTGMNLDRPNGADALLAIDHFSMQYQFNVAALQPAQTYRIMVQVPASTTITCRGITLQAEVIKK